MMKFIMCERAYPNTDESEMVNIRFIRRIWLESKENEYSIWVEIEGDCGGSKWQEIMSTDNGAYAEEEFSKLKSKLCIN